MKHFFAMITGIVVLASVSNTSLLAKDKAPTSASLFYGETSDNFIMRWHFQDVCDHVYDPRTSKWAWPTKPGGVRFRAKDVKPGDIIFARDIPQFFKEMHPKIEHPYVLVTHGEFRDTCYESDLNYLDDEKVIAWFGIHPCKNSHPKYYPLPIGLKQPAKPFSQERKHELNAYLKELRETTPKTKLLYMNFEDERNPERRKLRSLLAKKPYCTVPKKRLEFLAFLKEMAEHKFALSPRGWGPDCYRTWEALFVGTIPIVRRGVSKALLPTRAPLKQAQLDLLYKNLPIVVVDDWKEVTMDFLNKEYERITSRQYNINRLYVEYWFEVIKTVRDDFMRHYNAQ